jgi:hypothetical protein
MRKTTAKRAPISFILSKLNCPFSMRCTKSGEDKALYDIDTLEILRGGLSRRAHGMVIEWAKAHKQELLENWERARERVPLERIVPLE